MSAEEQTQMLASYISENIQGEPSRNEGAGECAIRIMEEQRAQIQEIEPGRTANPDGGKPGIDWVVRV